MTDEIEMLFEELDEVRGTLEREGEISLARPTPVGGTMKNAPPSQGALDVLAEAVEESVVENFLSQEGTGILPLAQQREIPPSVGETEGEGWSFSTEQPATGERFADSADRVRGQVAQTAGLSLGRESLRQRALEMRPDQQSEGRWRTIPLAVDRALERDARRYDGGFSL